MAARCFTDENACVSFIGVEKRPASIIVIGILFILLGTITLVHALMELINTTDRLTDLKSHWMIYLSAIAAIVGGAFLLKGHNWGTLAPHPLDGFSHRGGRFTRTRTVTDARSDFLRDLVLPISTSSLDEVSTVTR